MKKLALYFFRSDGRKHPSDFTGSIVIPQIGCRSTYHTPKTPFGNKIHNEGLAAFDPTFRAENHAGVAA